MNAKMISAVLAGLAMTCSVAVAGTTWDLQDNHPALNIVIDNQTDHPVSLDGVTVADHATHSFEVPVDASMVGSIDSDLEHAPAMAVEHTNQVCCAGHFGDVYGDLIKVSINGSITAICPTRINSVFDPISHLNLSFHNDDANPNNEVIVLSPEYHCDSTLSMDEDKNDDAFITDFNHVDSVHTLTEPRTTDSTELPEG